jgi:hypothetical protein
MRTKKVNDLMEQNFCSGMCNECGYCGSIPDEEEIKTLTCDCGEQMPLKVMQSAAGFYLGHGCINCGPYDRVSDYYPTHEAAEKILVVLMGD